MKLSFVTKNSIATLGTFMPVHKQDLKRYVRVFETHWVNA